MNKIENIIKAWELASQAHYGQKYVTTVSEVNLEYLTHIGRVTLEIQEAVKKEQYIDDELAIICAILHDTIEDTKVTYEDIEQQFGTHIAKGVLALTKNEQLSDKNEKMLDSLARIKQQPKEIWMVKMADRICNLQPPPHHWSEEKKLKYQQEAVLIYEQLKEGSPYLAARLKRKIEEY